MLPVEEEGPVVARRREAYYAAVASQSTYRSRLSIPAPRTRVGSARQVV
jgi:hypothetical protein